MIDSGATNNFISVAAVNRLHLQKTGDDRYGVTLGNGEKIFGKGKCQGVKVTLEIMEDYHILGLGNSDIILGMQWLEKLGEVVINWKKQSMKYHWNGVEQILEGDPSLERSKISLKLLKKTWSKEDQELLVEINHVESAGAQVAEIADIFREVVENFKEVFSEPHGLPPVREKDHAINLKEGTSPVSVRPYRYPQIQKDEIKRMVKDMLVAHIIRPSSSPSPARFCSLRRRMARGDSVSIIER